MNFSRALVALLTFAFTTAGSFADEKPTQATVLLVTSKDLAEAWQPFADWKTKLGKRTVILSTEQIGKDYEGGDIQEKIRRCVRHHIDNAGTTAVILGGDSTPGGGLVPDRDTFHENMWGKNEKIPTDVFYLSETDWDADGDGVFGEFKDDRDAISYPDGSVGIGRIPVRTADDVKAYTDKVIGYESRFPDGEYAGKIVYTCTVPAAYNKLKTSWAGHVSKAWPDGRALQFFKDFTAWDKDKPGDYPLSPKNMVDLWNRKEVGKFHLHGHGLHDCWVMEKHEKLSFDHIAKLENKDAYPVITTVSCFTGQFDTKKDPSIVESILRKADGGAVIVVAPCREGKPHFHDPKKDFPLMVKEGKPDGTTLTMARFWSNGLGDNLEAGRALAKTKAGLAEDAQKSATYHMGVCELNLLGDPTLDLRASAPEAVEAEFPKSVPAKKQTVTILTKSPGATVCLWKEDDGVYAVKESDESGKATFEIEPKNKGAMSLSVSGTGLNAFVAEIAVE